MKTYLAYLIVVTVAGAEVPSNATEFWISPSSQSRFMYPAQDPGGDQTACLCGDIDSMVDVSVWVRTDLQSSDEILPFRKTLQNISLNSDLSLASSNNILFRNVEINNADERFDYVADSTPTTGIPEAFVGPNQIRRLQGFSILPGLTSGLNGGNIDDGELGSVGQVGNPGWRFATVGLEIRGEGMSTIEIEPGPNGINYVGESVGQHQGEFANLLLLVHPLGGDFNRDRVVNSSDFQVWQSNYYLRFGADCLTGDANFDGDVDGSDFLALQRNSGKSLASVAEVTPVPEPVTFLLCALGVLCMTVTNRGLQTRLQWSRQSRLLLTCLLLATTTASQSTYGQEQFIEWDNAGTGLWRLPSNWDPEIVPTSMNLMFDNSALFNNGGTAEVDFAIDSIKYLQVNNGTVHIDTGFALELTEDGTIGPDGTVELELDSALNLPNGLLTLDGGAIRGHGNINIGSQFLFNSGLFSPGDSQDESGQLTVNGDFVQDAVGTIEMQIRGTDPGENDLIVVSGNVTLGGTLIVDIDVPVLPSDRIPLIISDSTIHGLFDEVIFVNEEVTDMVWVGVSDGSTYYEERFPRGDMNLDRNVNFEDADLFAKAIVNPFAYNTFRSENPIVKGGIEYTYQTTGIALVDMTRDGVSNYDDLIRFAMEAGMPLSEVVAAFEAELSRVPEAGGLALTLAALLVLGNSRQRNSFELTNGR